MASGDPITESGSLSGGSSVTVTVPSGEVWAISAAHVCRPDLGEFGWNDGTADSRTDSFQNEPSGELDAPARPLFNDSVDPNLKNTHCNSQMWTCTGRQI